MWYTRYGLQLGIARYTFAVQWVKDKVVLEIGCENGYGASYLMSRGAKEVIGGDISGKAIEYAREHYQRGGLHFQLLDAQKLQFADKSFDVIVAFEVIEHLEKYTDFLDECQRVLKVGGTFICSTPNKEVISPNADKPWFPEHIKEFHVDEFRDVLNSYFDEVVIYGVCLGSKAPGLINRVIYSPKPRVFQFLKPAGVKIMNFVTRFIFQRYRLIALAELKEEDLDKMADKRYQPFLLQSNDLSPLDIIAVARK